MPDSTMVDPSAWVGWVEKSLPMVVTAGLKVIAAIAIYLIGRWIAVLISKMLRKVMLRSKVEPSLVSFISNLVYALIVIFVVIAAIGKLGVQTTSFIAIIGAAGLAVGMALQGSLSNFAAGVMLIIMKPFKIGDSIKAAGVAGTVLDLGVFYSAIATSDNHKIIVPNAKLSADIIENFSAMPTRRIELSIGVPGSTDLIMAKELLLAIVNSEDKVLKAPAASVAVTAADAEAITFGVYAHTNNADMGSVQTAVMEKTKTAFTMKGIWV